MAQKAINVAGGDGTVVPAGMVGQEITTGPVSVALSVTSDVFVLVTASGITLQPGVYDIYSQLASSASIAFNRLRISTSNSSSTTGQITSPDIAFYGAGNTTAGIAALSIAPIRVVVTSTTTYYLWGANQGTAGGTHYGVLKAVKVV